MEFKVKLPNFRCPDNLTVHLEKVFDGEYDIPLHIWQPRILDLGANVGAFAIWAAYRWSGSKVYSYEPDPENFKLLTENLERNHIIPVVPINRAVGSPGVRRFYHGPNNSGEGGLHADVTGNLEPGVKIEVMDPLDLPHAHILKMDIEGCELEVLEPLLKDGREYDAILLEYHRAEDRRAIDALLGDYFLAGAEFCTVHRGVMKYLHGKYYQEFLPK